MPHILRDYYDFEDTPLLGEAYLENIIEINKYGKYCSPRGLKIAENLMSTIVGPPSVGQLLSVPGLRDVADQNTNEGRYLITELFWYFSGSKRTEFIDMFSSIWKNIRNHDETVNSNYGHQVFYEKAGNRKDFSRFQYAIQSLIKDRDSRQAIIPYTSQNIFDDDIRDFTCTQLQHFMIRDNNLYSIVYLRSSDAVYGLSFDIPWFSIVHQFAEKTLIDQGIEIGNEGELGICIGSSHIYEKHFRLCEDLEEYYEDKRHQYKQKECVKTLKVHFPTNTNSDTIERRIFIQNRYSEIYSLILQNFQNIMNEDFFNFEDNEPSYNDLYAPHFNIAKRLMNQFKKIHFVVDDDTKNSKEYKEIWFQVAKEYFDLFFEIF